MALTRLNNQALPAGSVLQVKTFKTTTQGTITGAAGAWGDILTGSITPNSTSSTIYITGHTMLGNPGTGLELGIKIVRGSTDFFIGDNGSNNSQTEATLGNKIAGSSENYVTWTPSWHCYDTPNTTSAVTYKLQAYGSESQNINLNRPRDDTNADYVFKGITSLILMEIAG